MPWFRVAIVGISIEILLRSPLPTTGPTLQVIRGDELDRDVWMIRGAIRRLRLESDFEVRPLIWATALPGGAVEATAYSAFKSETLDLLRKQGPFDGVVAVNHGALEIEGLNLSGDSDFLMAVRGTVGESVPIAVALDLHGNFTSQMLAAGTVFSVLRTAPHRDDDETGYRAADQLVRTLRRELRPFTAAVRVPILAPGEMAVTTQPPGRELYGQLPEIDCEPGVVEANLMIGFAWNDRPWSGMTALATASDSAETALKWALALARRAWDRRGDFRLEMETADIQPGIARAIAADDGPVYLSDSGDNTTAGAPGDLTLVLQAALDFLRRRARQQSLQSDESMDMIVDPRTPIEDRQAATVSLRTFMHLPVAERGAVILKEVMGYSLEEIGHVMHATVPATKAALHRGRRHLRELAEAPEENFVPVLAGPERLLLAAYVDRFNDHDFDAVREMLAEEVKLEVVNRLRLSGRREVSKYFTNYAEVPDWRLIPGFIDGRPGILVGDPADLKGRPTYFIVLNWGVGGILGIRDFRYARYAIEGAELVAL